MFTPQEIKVLIAALEYYRWAEDPSLTADEIKEVEALTIKLKDGAA